MSDAGSARMSSESRSLPKFLSLIAPLPLLVLIIRQFGLENAAFLQLAILSFSGFAVHYFLPLRFRLPFFLALSIGAMGLILGVGPAGWLVGTGLALIGLAYAPVPFRVRVAVLAVGAALLGVMRAGWAEAPWPAAIWPILGSMFMFRLIVFLYDVGHQPALGSPWARLSYFFLLPNVCFPLFPVVDYSTFCRTYYNDDRHRIYGVGVQWIFRGVVHLVLYKVVYQVAVIEPVSVANAVDLARYMVWPFLLYLRVSGQFHIIIGILRLFGFNLPETHHSYFLTSSFTDFWRRINIYWKDFMMKVFYYPAYFALRRRGETLAVVLSTVLVFVVTWALHAYQWFWLRGTFLFAWTDVLFWTLLAFFVVLNTVHEWRHGRQRVLTPGTKPWSSTLASALRTIGMFVFISVLWSLWSTESIGVWLSLWSAAAEWPAAGYGRTLLLVIAVPSAVFLWAMASSRGWLLKSRPFAGEAGGALVMVCLASGLVLLSWSRVYNRLGPVGTVVAAVRYGGLNTADAVNLERGYYENLMGVDRFNGDLWALYMNRPVEWSMGIVEAGVARPAGDLLPWELVPGASGRYKGAELQTNRWGMHDKEYTLEPPAGCYRIALLGASHAMGSGVNRSETFEAVLESRLNQNIQDSGPRCYEILNFAVYGYSPVAQIDVLERRVLEFKPNTVLYVGHPEDSMRAARSVALQITSGRRLPYEELASLARNMGVDAGVSGRIAQQRLAPAGYDILAVVYGRLVSDLRSRGICAGFIFLPMVLNMAYSTDVAREIQTARDAGFEMFDLSSAYAGATGTSLWIAEWDAHPNAVAHAIVAEKLDQLLEPGGHPSALLSCGNSQG